MHIIYIYILYAYMQIIYIYICIHICNIYILYMYIKYIYIYICNDLYLYRNLKHLDACQNHFLNAT